MSTYDILISMARYVHAFYDIEIPTDDPKLSAKLKRFMSVKADDKQLSEYWNDYLAASGNAHDVTNPVARDSEETDEAPAVFYRGVKVSGSADNSATQATQEQSSGKQKGVMYRGQKLI